MKFALAVVGPRVPGQQWRKIFHLITRPMCQTMGLARCSYSWIKNYGNDKNSPDSWELMSEPVFIFSLLFGRLAGARFPGVPSVESLVYLSPPGRPPWSREGTASTGQSKVRTGPFPFWGKHTAETFHLENFNASLFPFPFLALSSLHRKRERLARMFCSGDQGIVSRSCWTKKTQLFNLWCSLWWFLRSQQLL